MTASARACRDLVGHSACLPPGRDPNTGARRKAGTRLQAGNFMYQTPILQGRPENGEGVPWSSHSSHHALKRQPWSR